MVCNVGVYCLRSNRTVHRERESSTQSQMRWYPKTSIAAIAAACALGLFIQYHYAEFGRYSHRAEPSPGQRDNTSDGTSGLNALEARQALEQPCVERSQRLQRQLGAEYTVSVHSPFVLAGSPQVDLEDQYASVVQPACEILNRRFFDRPPSRPLAVLLFSGESEYRTTAERLFFDRKVSRFGYFKPGRRVVLANLAAGHAALRHELVHALMHADFPDAPPWLQEGLATMYEDVVCSANASGPHWEPVVNWRLTVLQRAIRAGDGPDLRQLLHASNLGGPDEAVAYAQARYLCMYLDRCGHLESVYRGMRDDVTGDPHGERALRTAFPQYTWSDLDRQFYDWVLSLEL